MDKILIGLFVPAVQKHFDLFVPTSVDIGTLTGLLADGVEDLCDGRFCRSKQEMLSMLEPDMLLHPDRTLADYGVKDGARLVML